MLLKGKAAVITGGARGIGGATAALFVRHGCRVVIADLLDVDGSRLAAILGAAAIFIRCDVTKEDEIEAAVALCVQRFGRIDVMFNNAGSGGTLQTVESMKVNDWDRVQDILLRSVVLGTKHAVRAMRAAGHGGSIINTASVAALEGGVGPIAYSVAKAGVISFSQQAAVPLGKHEIRVNAICPGGIMTPLIVGAGVGDKSWTGKVGLTDEMVGALIEEREAEFALMQPIRRAGRPGDIANTALYLASELSTYVTGQRIVVDGGLTAGRDPANELERSIELVTDPERLADKQSLAKLPKERRVVASLKQDYQRVAANALRRLQGLPRQGQQAKL